MYSVLIVDDFAIDRQNLADAVRSFNKLPLHIIGVCENAYDALEIIRNMETDILICDVEMPGMTGIELASTLRAESFRGRIIFCSLYDKLHYLKAAIAVHSDGYITKPFSRGELENCLHRIIQNFQDLDQQRQQLRQLQDTMRSHQIKLRRELCSDVLLCYDISEEECLRRQRMLGMDDGSYYRVGMVEIDLESTAMVVGDASAVPYQVYQELKRNLDVPTPYYVVRMNERFYTLVFSFAAEVSTMDSRHMVETVLNALTLKLREQGVMTTATFSTAIKNLRDIRKQYELCMRLLSNKGNYGGDNVVFAEEDAPQAVSPTLLMQTCHAQLTELLTKEAENPEQAVAAFLNDVMEGASFPQRQMLCHYLLGSVQFIVQQETGTDERFENELNGMLMQNHAFSSPEDCRRFAEQILLFAYQRLHQQEGGRYDELIQQIKEYIRTSDLKSIHLGMIADHFSYSPNYLNHIFKEVTDVTILDYITHCRIRQAKKLMTETNKNLTAIAAEVGYSHATYLSIVFKRQEGMTPKQFMEGRR